jgi:ABC-type multidrug transport system ATPase subunit
MVVVDRLTKTYGRTTALSDVSLTVRTGEVLGLIGPNGAGKTTLFECLAGVLPYDTGRITIEGTPLTSAGQGSRIFYMPDAIAPWPSQTVRWALDFAAGFFGGSPASVPDVVARLDLRPLLGSVVATLSKGQRKRVLLGIGMVTPHPLLLCDEPFDGLDLRQTREISGALREHAAAGRTLFLSIHQISDAARVCDRFVLLSGGRVRGEGTLEELNARNQNRNANPNSNPLNLLNPTSLEDIFLALT